MLDIVLIQYIPTGLNVFEFRQKHAKIDERHSDIFGGFLSAIQSITKELDIGAVVLISTQGEKGHNCIIVNRDPIRVILLVDEVDPISVWRETAELIAEKFIEKYGKYTNYANITQFKDFKSILKPICDAHNYCGEI
ncbi:MAG: hypothetical protein BAJALOKI1v1_610006 [Promethearchaeota archaeon]|nr:MAG: hypothetical protein BAJALOKI1v1_610006 [Candidatus Lokiarchaeota archaeon]